MWWLGIIEAEGGEFDVFNGSVSSLSSGFISSALHFIKCSSARSCCSEEYGALNPMVSTTNADERMSSRIVEDRCGTMSWSDEDDDYDDDSFDELSQSKVGTGYEIEVGTTIDIGGPALQSSARNAKQSESKGPAADLSGLPPLLGARQEEAPQDKQAQAQVPEQVQARDHQDGGEEEAEAEPKSILHGGRRAPRVRKRGAKEEAQEGQRGRKVAGLKSANQGREIAMPTQPESSKKAPAQAFSQLESSKEAPPQPASAAQTRTGDKEETSGKSRAKPVRDDEDDDGEGSAQARRGDDQPQFEPFTAFHANIEAKMKQRSEQKRKQQEEWERHFRLSRKLKERERRRRIREQRKEFSKAMESIAQRKKEKEERRSKERRMEELRRQRLHQRRLLGELRRKAREEAMSSPAAKQLQQKASTMSKKREKQREGAMASARPKGQERKGAPAWGSPPSKNATAKTKASGGAGAGQEGGGAGRGRRRGAGRDQAGEGEVDEPRPNTTMRTVQERKIMEGRRRRNIAEKRRNIAHRKRREAERDELRRERLRRAKEEEERALDMEKRKLIALQHQRHLNFSKLRNEDSPVFKLEQRRKKQLQFEQGVLPPIPPQLLPIRSDPIPSHRTPPRPNPPPL